MGRHLKATGLACMFAAMFCQVGLSSPISDTYATGDTLTAGKLNNIKTAVNDNDARIGANTADIAALKPAVSDNDARISANTADIAALKPTGAVYRWNVFSTYSQGSGWYFNNSTAMTGGVNPSSWTDGNALASQMSSDKEVLRTLFSRKGYGGRNALVYADEWTFYSSTNSKVVVALFRIANTTGAPIVWTPIVFFTCYGGWNEWASAALNGVGMYNSAGGNLSPVDGPISVPMTIPANRTSTAIFVSMSSNPNAQPTRSTVLAFGTNSLALPAGLEYVDDLDRATGDFSQ